MSNWVEQRIYRCDCCGHEEVLNEGETIRGWAIDVTTLDIDDGGCPVVFPDQDLCPACARIYGRVYASILVGSRSEVGEKNAIEAVEQLRWPSGRPGGATS
jgi:hypothetical protein